MITQTEVSFFCDLFSGRSKNCNVNLLALKFVLFALNHWFRFNRSKLIFLLSLRELLAYNRFVSSAKRCIFKCFIGRLKSFMYMRNNKDPQMVSCGTPYLIVWVSDLLLLIVYTEFWHWDSFWTNQKLLLWCRIGLVWNEGYHDWQCQGFLQVYEGHCQENLLSFLWSL